MPLQASRASTPSPNHLAAPITPSTPVNDILAAFRITPSPSKPPPISPVPLATDTIIMTDKSRTRSLRQKDHVVYTISDDSDAADTGSAADSSAFGSSAKFKRGRPKKIIDLDDETEDEEPEALKTPPERVSAAGHSLRPHKSLKQSLQALENGDKPRKKKRKLTQRQAYQPLPKVSSDLTKPAPRTARNAIRDSIASDTAAKRAKFFVEKKDLFLPLLPENNHISKLVEQHHRASHAHGDNDIATTEYEALEQQPKGVKAVMKPYQLAGLSFLVYLQRNGLSGILGDEMGLGKTLQALSLIQYLKENHVGASSDENRPSLVVCPLSVLSSWMAESRKWTPDLKVLRFHGPSNERDRLKRVALGEEDMYGEATRLALQKKNHRLAAAGKNIISLDSDSEVEDALGVDLVVTTYETYLSEQAWFKKAFVWRYVILDEGHKIKSEQTQISTALQGLGAEYRLILTGTPLQNNLMELWALLHWLYPEVFTIVSSELFKRAFDLNRGTVSTSVMDDSRRLLELIMLRRLKNSPGVDLNLPPKTDVLLFVPLTPMQRFWYTRLLTKADQGLLEELFQGAKDKEVATFKEEGNLKSWEEKGIEQLDGMEKTGTTNIEWEESKEILKRAVERENLDEGKKSAWKKLMNLLMQLRKCCNHPYILPNAAPEPYYIGDHIIHGSGKFVVLDKLIDELVLKQKKKVLIFSGFTRMLDCCEDFLALKGGQGTDFRYMRLDGATARARRNLGIRMFNDIKSDYRVMLISTRAGGLGINLASASDVIMLDQDWNPQIMLQAEARAHRIGQTQPVTVYKLITQGTVEEQMMGRIQKKLYLSAKVTESMRNIHSSATSKNKGPKVASGGTDEDMPQLDTSQLMSLVRRGAQALSHPEINVNEMMNWDWPTMLAMCKDKPADLQVSETLGNSAIKAEDEQSWLNKMEHVESRIFQGKKWSKKEEISGYGDIQQAWAREERRIGKNTTVMVDGFAVSKESMRCGDWEAVPTFAGKDPRLAEVKREKRAAINNQEHCQVCYDGGDIVLCAGCPRSYHLECLAKPLQALARSKFPFHCPQHQCADCQQKTGDAGGMLYRCRWCERSYCEDCLEWDKTLLLGDTLKEFEMVGFPAVMQAFYIQCQGCTESRSQDVQVDELCARQEQQIDHDYAIWATKEEEEETPLTTKRPSSLLPSPAESMVDGTTCDDSGLSTPKFNALDEMLAPARGSKASRNFQKFSAPKRPGSTVYLQ